MQELDALVTASENLIAAFAAWPPFAGPKPPALHAAGRAFGNALQNARAALAAAETTMRGTDEMDVFPFDEADIGPPVTTEEAVARMRCIREGDAESVALRARLAVQKVALAYYADGAAYHDYPDGAAYGERARTALAEAGYPCTRTDACAVSAPAQSILEASTSSSQQREEAAP